MVATLKVSNGGSSKYTKNMYYVINMNIKQVDRDKRVKTTKHSINLKNIKRVKT